MAGLSGHGFKFTSVLGEIASQLATTQATSQDLDLFAIGVETKDRVIPSGR